ncbi:MAG: amidohydrolase [Clostridia bacterium]|nr:amidohydrolase [Clostridia bacterium]
MWKQCENLQEQLIDIRRELHKIPELGFDLPKTRALICQALDNWGVAYTLSDLDSAVLGEIRGEKPGKTILLRADIDALPVQEENPVDYVSTHPGKMHACGHDAHGAMLLGAIKVLHDNRDKLCGSVKFVFQTAEETVDGAVKAIQAGALDNVDAVFGCHIGNLLDPNLPAGTFSIAPGCVMASVDSFKITVHGKGCHGSSPEKGVDPITIASHIVINLQEILAREIAAIHPTSLTIGYIKGGDASNIVPDTVQLGGTLRALAPSNREFVLKRIQEIAASTAALFRGSCEMVFDSGAKPVENDAAMAALAARAAKKVVGEDFVQTAFPPNMGSEDFSEYLALRPGAFYFLSSAADDASRVPHHNPRFNIDESVLWKGSAVFVSIAEEYLNKGE